MFGKLRCGEYGYSSSKAKGCVCIDAQSAADARKDVGTDRRVRPGSITCIGVWSQIIDESVIDKLDIFDLGLGRTLDIDG